MRKLVSSFCAAACACLISGCDSFQSATQSFGLKPEPPTLAQTEAVELVKPLLLKIEKCYWADEFEKPGFQNLPEKFRTEQRQQYVAKPAAKFLVIQFSVLNPSSQPLAWGQSQPPVFRLKSAKGAEYIPVGQDINLEDLSAKILMQGGSVNPGMNFTGLKVFDVPKDDYVLSVSLGTPTGGWQYVEGATRFRWSLSPTESK
jgi:hypothetical protein